jgi:hypothetical protein
VVSVKGFIQVVVGYVSPKWRLVTGPLNLLPRELGRHPPGNPQFRPPCPFCGGRSGAPGVDVHRVLCGPFSQSLHWDAESRQLICIQDVVARRCWRFDLLDLSRAVGDGRGDGGRVCGHGG